MSDLAVHGAYTRRLPGDGRRLRRGLARGARLILGAAAGFGTLFLASAGTLTPAAAQQPGATPTPAAARPQPALDPNADVAITATVRAAELRFEAVPTVTVQFSGAPARTTVWDTVHDNLPAAPQPGVTYRDVGVQVTITSAFEGGSGGAAAAPTPAAR